MRSHTLTPRLLFVAVAALVISAAGSRYARSAENEENNTLRTAHSTYTISGTPEREFSQCLRRNGKQLFCGDLNLYFDDVVKTKNYNLIPLHSSCGGNGCPSQNVWLIIEKGSTALVKNVVEDCYGCELASVRTSSQADTVNFKIGNNKGYRLTASFRGGTLSVHRSKIGPKLDTETCSGLHEAIKACAASDARPCRVLYDQSAGGNRQMNSIENDYPRFSRDAFRKECENVCASQKEISFQTFSRKFCRA
ncbi:MAG: hypothetical protein ACREEK_18360 [Bradyrhizobium sp.]